MTMSLIWFALSAAGIVTIAKYALYDPVQRLVSYTRATKVVSGQILGYLTSAPELVSTVFIAATGFFTAAAFNVLGSNVINVFLVITAALWFKHLRTLRHARYRLDLLIVGASIVLPLALVLTDTATQLWTVPLFLTLLIAYFILLRARSEPPKETGSLPDLLPSSVTKWVVNSSVVLAGLVGLYFLGSQLGDSVYSLGYAFGVPAVVLGGLAAIATSLPEFTTFFSSFAKNGSSASTEVVHNLLASNVSNLLIIQTIGVIVYNLAT